MQKPITTTLDDNSIVTISINGDLLDEQTEALVSSIKEASTFIAETFHRLNEPLKTMVDLDEFTGRYSVSSIVQMIHFSNATKQYVQKLAVVSSEAENRMAAEMVGALSQRNDMKIFSDKKEAIDWLLSS